jgi:hypothetical protein
MAYRPSGSCRFEAYYKVELWNKNALAWKGVQKAHPTAAEAFNAAPANVPFRIVTVSEKGREFGQRQEKNR